MLLLAVCHPRWVLAGAALLTLLGAVQVPRIGVQLDGRSLIPLGHPSQAASDEAARRFAHQDAVIVGVTAEEGVFQPVVLALVREVSELLAATPGVDGSSVVSLATLPRLAIEGDVLDPRPLLSSDRAGPGIPSQALAADLRREVEAMGLDDGILVSTDGSTTLVAGKASAEVDRVGLLEELRRRLAGLDEGAARLHLSGPAPAQALLGSAVAGDLMRLIPLVLIVLVAALVVLFRHPVPALAALVEVGISLVLTAGLMGLGGASLFVTTLVLPVILIVIGVSDDVYALEIFFQDLRREVTRALPDVVVDAFGRVATPILLTTITTAGGLLSLAATPLVPQRVFGLYGALALLLSSLMTFTVLPALLVLLLPRFGRIRPAWKLPARWDSRAWLRAIQAVGPGKVVLTVTAVTVVAAVGALGVRIEDSWVGNLPPDGDVARATAVLDSRTAGTLRLELAVDSGRPGGLLEPGVFAALGELEERLRQRPEVGAVAGIYTDVVRARSALEATRYSAMRDALARGGARLSADQIDQTLLLFSSLRSSPLEQRADAELRTAWITLFLPGANYSKIDRLLEAIRAESTFPAIVPFGDAWISHQTVDLLVVGQIRSVALATGTTLFLLLLMFRAPATALLAIAPTVVSLALVFAFLAVAGLPLGIASSMFAAITLGIGVDYSIHLVAHYRDHRRSGRPAAPALGAAFAETAPAIGKSVVAVAAGLSLLGLSSIAPNAQLGILLCLGLTVCALVTVVLVPALILVGDRFARTGWLGGARGRRSLAG